MFDVKGLLIALRGTQNLGITGSLPPALACSAFRNGVSQCRVELAPGVDYVRTADVKDQIELSGNDIQAVSMTGKSERGNAVSIL